MDWLKRNWVDLLMAGLILAVVGGFLTLLLRGGVFVSNNQATPTTTPTPVTTVPAPTGSPTPPTPSPSTPTPTAAPSKPSTPTPSKPVPSSQPAQKPATASSTVTKPRDTASLSVPEIPAAPSQPETPTNKPSSSSSKPASSSSSQPIASSSSSQPIASSSLGKPAVSNNTRPPSTNSSASNQPSAVAAPSKTTYSRADFLRNYRVAAGSYSNLERSQKAVAQLKARGLPAVSFPSGNTYVVVVGPYGKEAAARRALVRVRQIFPDAILYRPDGTREVAALRPSSKPTDGGGSGGQPSTLTATTTTAYLQVGAFKDSKSAATLFAKLKEAGFSPLTKNIAGLLRVLVGPFDPAQIQTTRSELKTQGFEAFPVNL